MLVIHFGVNFMYLLGYPCEYNTGPIGHKLTAATGRVSELQIHEQSRPKMKLFWVKVEIDVQNPLWQVPVLDVRF